MFVLSSTTLLGLVLLAAPTEAAQSPLPTCEAGTRHLELKADAPLKAHEVCIHLGLSSYRSDTERKERERKVVRLAVELDLRNDGNTPWTPTTGALVRPKHAALKALSVWPLEPIPPGKKHRVAVEVEATEEAARGTFSLELWSQEGGARSERFDGVTFP